MHGAWGLRMVETIGPVTLNGKQTVIETGNKMDEIAVPLHTGRTKYMHLIDLDVLIRNTRISL